MFPENNMRLISTNLIGRFSFEWKYSLTHTDDDSLHYNYILEVGHACFKYRIFILKVCL